MTSRSKLVPHSSEEELSEDGVELQMQEDATEAEEEEETSASNSKAEHEESSVHEVEVLSKENGHRRDHVWIDINIDDAHLDSAEVRARMAKIRPPTIPYILQFKNLGYSVKVPVPSPPTASFAKKTLHAVIGGIQSFNPFYKPKVVEKTILKNISGKVVPGEFLAIMGPTGSGKTTLLGVLARRLRHGVTGEIKINGKPPTKNYKRRVAYVLQDDVLFANLTVEQTLTFTAKLRLPNMTEEEKKQKVDEIIEILNLNKARHTIIGGPFIRGVSGGERKRVNIGNELLTNPNIVLLDEPTSGLDTSTALNLVRILKGMADAGLTVIASIHQPSSQMYELFDKLLLLVDGQPTYYGKASEAVSYFASIGLSCSKFYNPADFMMGLILQEELNKTADMKNKLIKAYAEINGHDDVSAITEKNEVKLLKKLKKKTEDTREAKFAASYIEQFTILLQRSFLQSRGTNISKIPFFQMIVVALVVGGMWWQCDRVESRIQDRLGAVFFVGVFSGGFTPVFNAIWNFPPERAVLQRERSAGSYQLSAYFLAKNVADFPFDVMYPFLFVFIAYWMVGFGSTFWNFLVFLVVTTVTIIASSSMGLAISAKILNVKVGGVCAGVAMLAMMLIGGFYVDLDELPPVVRYLKYASVLKFSYDALLINELRGTTFEQVPGFNSPWDDHNPITGEDILATRAIEVNSVWGNVGIILLWGAFWKLLAYVFLKYTYKQKS